MTSYVRCGQGIPLSNGADDPFTVQKLPATTLGPYSKSSFVSDPAAMSTSKVSDPFSNVQPDSTVSAAPVTSASTSNTSTNLSGTDSAAFLDAHNTFRAQYNALALTWSTELATYAQSYASKCVFEHSQGQYGESGWSLSGMNFEFYRHDI